MSIVSGTQVCKALWEKGHRAILLDVFLGYEDDFDIETVFEDKESLLRSEVQIQSVLECPRSKIPSLPSPYPSPGRCQNSRNRYSGCLIHQKLPVFSHMEVWMDIVVLAGGLSMERDVSIVSCRRPAGLAAKIYAELAVYSGDKRTAVIKARHLRRHCRYRG